MKRTRYLKLSIVIMSICGWMTAFSQPVASASGNDYFDYTYTLELSQTQVQANESFTAHVYCQATCKKSLPVKVTAGIITGKVVARLQEKSIEVILNSHFVMQIDGIPRKAGESFQKEMDIFLRSFSGWVGE